MFKDKDDKTYYVADTLYSEEEVKKRDDKVIKKLEHTMVEVEVEE